MTRRYNVRPNIPVRRENQLAKMLRGELSKTIYAVNHTCGHMAWWDDKELSELLGNEKCPWCGGISGNRASPMVNIVHSLGRGMHVRRDIKARCDKHEKDVRIEVQ